ncbi:MAG: hypothetical protein R2838_25855 [Caldilineaceae bacterium]
MLPRAFDGRLHAPQRRKAVGLGALLRFNGLVEMITASSPGHLYVACGGDYGLRLWEGTSGFRDWGDWEIGRSGVRTDPRTDSVISQFPPISINLRLPNLQSSLLNLALLGAVAFLLWSPALVPLILRQFLTDTVLKGWGEVIC